MVKEKKEKSQKSLLEEFEDLVDSPYAGIAENGIISGDINGYISTGSLAFNAQISGSMFRGLPDNKILFLAGEESTGKTFIALTSVKEFTVSNPTGVVVIFETEGGLTKAMLVDRGIDPKRILVVPTETVEETSTKAVKVIDRYLTKTEKYRRENPMMMVLDSLGMLSTTKEVADTESGSDKKDMTRAQQIKKMFRTITLKMSIAKVPWVITNHTYDETGPFAKRVMSGGSGGKYASSITVFFSKAQYKEGETRVGSILTATLKKGRLTREGTQVKLLLRNESGLDKYYGVLPLAIESGVFTKASAKDGNAKKLDVKAEKEKGNGKLVVGTDPETGELIVVKESEIIKNPTLYFTDEVLQQIDIYCQKKFMFGSAADALNADIDEDEYSDIVSEDED